MSDNWIKFEEAMPKLNQKIEVKTENLKTYKCTLLLYYYAFHSFGFKLSEENDLSISDTPIWWRSLKGEDNKADDWTLFEDKLPELGKHIEVLDDEGESKECKLTLKKERTGCFELRYKNDSDKNNIKDYCYNPYFYKKWRYKKERRPDFKKLKQDDIIVGNLEFSDGERNFFAGCFREITEDGWLRMTFIDYDNITWDGFKIKNIKRILKVNLESKTLEEI